MVQSEHHRHFYLVEYYDEVLLLYGFIEDTSQFYNLSLRGFPVLKVSNVLNCQYEF